jgi:hypothetical protein
MDHPKSPAISMVSHACFAASPFQLSHISVRLGVSHFLSHLSIESSSQALLLFLQRTYNMGDMANSIRVIYHKGTFPVSSNTESDGEYIWYGLLLVT